MPISVPNTGWVKQGTVVSLKTGSDTVAIGAAAMSASEKQRVVGTLALDVATTPAPAANTGHVYFKTVSGRREFFAFGDGTSGEVQLTDNGSVAGGGAITGTPNLTFDVNDDAATGAAGVEDAELRFNSTDGTGNSDSLFVGTLKFAGIAGPSSIPALELSVTDDAAAVAPVIFVGPGLDASPLGATVQATSGQGANIAGATLTLAGGQSTGSGAGGAVTIASSEPGVSGSAQNALVTLASFPGTQGVWINPGTANASMYIVDSAPGTLFDNCTVLGVGATATQNGCVTIGQGATNDGLDSVCIGRAAAVTGGVADTTVVIGASAANNFADRSVVIGEAAGGSGTGANSVAVGRAAKAGSSGVAIGNSANSTGDTSSTAIGPSASTTGSRAFALGSGTSAQEESIVLGVNMSSGGARTINLGGVGADASTTLFLNQDVDTAPTNFVVRPSSGSGTDINGADLAISPGIGTGTGFATFRLQVAPSGASSATLNTNSDALTMDGSGGAVNLGFYGATPTAKPTITGSRAGNAALADLLTQLATLGLLTDSTSA